MNIILDACALIAVIRNELRTGNTNYLILNIIAL